MSNFLRFRIRIWGLLTAAASLAGIASLAGFLGRFNWALDLASHFRVQYALFFFLSTLCFALGRKKRAAGLSLLFLLINLTPVALFLLPRANGNHEVGTSLKAMLMNVNTQRGDPKRVCEAIAAEDPDILVLEEVNDEWMHALGPVLEAYTCRTIRTREDNFGIGLLSKLPCTATRVEYIGAAGVPSIIAEITIDGQRVTVLATHALPPAGKERTAYRNDQLRKVAQRVNAIPGPRLLLGDLNTSPWSPHYRDFIKASGLKNSSEGRNIRPTWPAYAPLLWIPIDHCLHTDDIVIQRKRVGQNVGSDHYPVIVDFALRANDSLPK